MKIVLKLLIIVIVLIFFVGIIMSTEYLYNLKNDCYTMAKLYYEIAERRPMETYKIDSRIIRDQIKINTFISRFNTEIYLQELPAQSILIKEVGDIVREEEVITEDNLLALREGRIVDIVYQSNKTTLHIDLTTNYEFTIYLDIEKIQIVNNILNDDIKSINVSGKEIVEPVLDSYWFDKTINKYLIQFRFDCFYEILIDKRPITVTFVKEIHMSQLVFPEECIKRVNFNQTFLYAERIVYLDEQRAKYITEDIEIPIEKKINDYYIVSEGYYLNFDFVLAG